MCCYPVAWCIINSLLDLNKVLDLNKRAVMLYDSGMIQPLDYAFIDCNRTWSSIWNVAFLQDRHNQRHHVAHGPELWHRSRCVMWWFRGSFVAKRMWLTLWLPGRGACQDLDILVYEFYFSSFEAGIAKAISSFKWRKIHKCSIYLTKIGVI